MHYARWATQEEMKEILKQTDPKGKVEEAGLPLIYEKEAMYIEKENSHSLIIGSTGSGKTQTVTLPLCRLAIKAEESMVINDSNGELYTKLIGELEKENYNVIVLDFDDPKKGNGWNPLTLPYTLYRNGQKDKALELIDSIGYYIFPDKSDNRDPFWTNSCISYFIGLVLYLFENAKEEEIHLNSVFALSNDMRTLESKEEGSIKKWLVGLDKNSVIYMQLSSTLLAPPDTRGSIISVFEQMLKNYVTRENLSKMLCKSDFDIQKMGTEKTALFMVSGMKNYSDFLVPMFVEQAFHSIDLFGQKERTVHMILDEFEKILLIRNFNALLRHATSISVKFTALITSFTELKNVYGKENLEIMKYCFGNMIYLLSKDMSTLEEISKMCGNTLTEENKVLPLITVEELKTLKKFEAVVLIPRMMPFKTKLIPDYQIDWEFVEKEKEIPNLLPREVSIFHITPTL